MFLFSMTQRFKNAPYYASHYNIGAYSTSGANSNLESAPSMALLAHGIALESAPKKLES